MYFCSSDWAIFLIINRLFIGVDVSDFVGVVDSAVLLLVL